MLAIMKAGTCGLGTTELMDLLVTSLRMTIMARLQPLLLRMMLVLTVLVSKLENLRQLTLGNNKILAIAVFQTMQLS